MPPGFVLPPPGFNANMGSHAIKAGLLGAGLSHGSIGLISEDFDNLLNPPRAPAGMVPDTDWLCNGLQWMTKMSSRKKSTNWLRPEFHIEADKYYHEMSYGELMFGMSRVMDCIQRAKIPGLCADAYLEHLKFVTLKGRGGLFPPEALARYDHRIVTKVMDRRLPEGFIGNDAESVSEHLSAEHMTAVKDILAKSQGKFQQSGRGRSRRRNNRGGGRRVDCPSGVCPTYNFNWCDNNDCSLKHVCAGCGGYHKAKNCRSEKQDPPQPRANDGIYQSLLEWNQLRGLRWNSPAMEYMVLIYLVSGPLHIVISVVLPGFQNYTPFMILMCLYGKPPRLIFSAVLDRK